jgi:hypothetical protein
MRWRLQRQIITSHRFSRRLLITGRYLNAGVPVSCPEPLPHLEPTQGASVAAAHSEMNSPTTFGRARRGEAGSLNATSQRTLVPDRPLGGGDRTAPGGWWWPSPTRPPAAQDCPGAGSAVPCNTHPSPSSRRLRAWRRNPSTWKSARRYSRSARRLSVMTVSSSRWPARDRRQRRV